LVRALISFFNLVLLYNQIGYVAGEFLILLYDKTDYVAGEFGLNL
jgi:hypothetical protein